MNVTGLVPGMSLNRSLTITNPNNNDVVLQSITATVGAVSPSPAAGLTCTAGSDGDFEVLLDSHAQATLGKKSSSTAVPVTIRMNDSATRNQDGCKSKTFRFTFTATATSK
jgi:hypothetical protein